MNIHRFLSLVVITIFIIAGITAQSQQTLQTFSDEMAEQNITGIELQHSSSTTNKDIGITYEYYFLTYQGIEIEGRRAIFALDQEGDIKVKHIPTLPDQPRPFTVPAGLENQLIYNAIAELDPTIRVDAASKLEFANNALTFQHNKQEFTLKNKILYSLKSQKLIPIIQFQLFQSKSYKSYEINYDINTQEFYDLHPLYYECKTHADHLVECSGHHDISHKNSVENTSAAAAYYTTRLPQESPLDGMALHAASPDFIASPYGWHDTDGEDGPDTDYLAGNNVSVIIDRNGDQADDTLIQDAELQFDFVPDFTKGPYSYRQSSATNQFYIVNQMHDILFNNGFDEESNFQGLNYYGDGKGSDAVSVYVQFLADYNIKNNAFFSPKVDGEAPDMFFFVFDGGQNGNHIEILRPSRHQGIHKASILLNGGSLRDTTITAEVVLPEDAMVPIEDGCETYSNDVTGKIVLVSLSSCTPYIQVTNAISAGAAAILISYNSESTFPIQMPSVSIPVLFIKNSTKLALLDGISRNEKVEIKLFDEGLSYVDRDASFENNIIAHEYAHGVTNRLIGGPGDVSCMLNREQMGEGWSDFYGYILTMSPENHQDEVRYIGTYVLGNSDDVTIRKKPYSSNRDINDYTYTDIKFTAGSPHDLGEIWGTMLWDLTQAFVEEYGYQKDLIVGNGGNRRVLNLVTEALKLTPCNPGFIDGRDAIIQADEFLYDGENRCLIWKVFAERGLGYGAQQNDTYDETDGVESYELHPSCSGGISVGKFMTESIRDGDSITVEVQIINKDGQSHRINVADQLPEFTTYVDGSGTISLSEDSGVLTNDNEMTIRARDTITYSYQLISEKDKGSVAIFLDSLDEDSEADYIFTSIFPEDYSKMRYTTQEAATGDYSFNINHTKNNQELILQYNGEIDLGSSEYPFLKFSHKHDLTHNFEGVVVEVSTDGGGIWNGLDDSMLKNGYQDKVSPYTFFFQNRNGFTGIESEWYTSYIDLSDYAGESIMVRWKVGTNSGNYADTDGWYIDDISIWDRYNVSSELCVTYDSDEECVYAEEYGTFVFSDRTVSLSEPSNIEPRISIYPNPTQNSFTIKSDEILTHYKLINTSGKTIHESDISNAHSYEANIENLIPGIYFIQLTAGDKTLFHKIVKN